MSDELPTTECPAGAAIIERVGWEEDSELGRRFTATLVFPNGPPDLPMIVVWDGQPVRLERAR